MFIIEGFLGLLGFFQYDIFYGFFKEEGKDKLVFGGCYCLFMFVMFVVEYVLFGENVVLMYVFNVFWYGFIVVVLYLVLLQLFQQCKGWDKNISFWVVYVILFMVVVFFVVYLIYIEVVVNIKGCDEIIILFGSFMVFLLVLCGGVVLILLVVLSFFVVLFFKENVIIFFGVVLLVLYFFINEKVVGIICKIVLLLGVVILFLFIWGFILGWSLGEFSMELMNNFFWKIEGGFWVDFIGVEKLVIIIYILGKYVQFLVVFYLLMYDYYFCYVEIMNWGCWEVLLGLLFYFGLLVYGIWGLVCW